MGRTWPPELGSFREARLLSARGSAVRLHSAPLGSGGGRSVALGSSRLPEAVLGARGQERGCNSYLEQALAEAITTCGCEKTP